MVEYNIALDIVFKSFCIRHLKALQESPWEFIIWTNDL